MNSLRINDVNTVRVGYSLLRTHPTLKCEMADLHLCAGRMEVCLSFETWDAMIKFCEEHNFEYVDERDL